LRVNILFFGNYLEGFFLLYITTFGDISRARQDDGVWFDTYAVEEFSGSCFPVGYGDFYLSSVGEWEELLN
jgi:hypothetical protein